MLGSLKRHNDAETQGSTALQLIIEVPRQHADRAEAIRTAILDAIAGKDTVRSLGNVHLRAWAKDDSESDRIQVRVATERTKHFTFQPIHRLGEPARWSDKHKGRKALAHAVRRAIGNRNEPTRNFVFAAPRWQDRAAAK